ALGDYREHPVTHLVAVADFYKGSNLLIGTKSRIEGVTLRATDTDWSNGTGPEAAGPAVAVGMAMTGRRAPLDGLSGPGRDRPPVARGSRRTVARVRPLPGRARASG